MPIPTQISSTWEFLNGEVIWLHGRWSVYQQLFGTSERRIGYLNQVAPTFFCTLQVVLLDEVQLTLSRLADPASSGRRTNLTLKSLAIEIQQIPEPALHADVIAALEAYRNKCERIIMRRNRRIAHYDRPTHVSAGDLPGASREEIVDALDALRVCMRVVYQFYMNSYMAYEHFILNDDANAIVRAAAEALRYRELVETGVLDSLDFVSSRFARI